MRILKTACGEKTKDSIDIALACWFSFAYFRYTTVGKN